MKPDTINLANILDISVFLLLNFLGVAGRISWEVEKKKIRFKLGSFVNRLFITTIFTYITEIFILRNERLREYYTEIILLVAFFMMDIIDFIIKYKNKILLYILNIFTKGIKDIADQVNKDKE